jgi:hypothetical protein
VPILRFSGTNENEKERRGFERERDMRWLGCPSPLPLPTSLGFSRLRLDMELYSECLWVEIPTVDGLSMLIGNRYFSSGIKPEVISDYFRLLENVLNTSNFW